MMKVKYNGLLKKVKDSHRYWAEIFTLEFVEDIASLMEKQCVSQKDLAEMMGNSEAYVSKVLNGYENLSINSMSKIAFALSAAPHIHVAPKDQIVEWKERSSGESRAEVSFQPGLDVSIVPMGNYTTTILGTENKFRQAIKLPGEISDGWKIGPYQGFLGAIN